MSVAAPHRELGLTDVEYDGICERLGREPNALELAVFSLMWSEHCAYKHSRKLLRQLPTEGAHVLMGPGENAGVVDVGDGLAVAFKVESHNHPSAVEPFQGAATGVGGILRDVFAVGARPIAVLDSLRFGELSSARSRYLLDGAVQGIGHYGNSIGVPTVGGEVYFEAPYEQNCLVNAMCLGIARHDGLIRSAAAGVGNHVVLLGARTGRDGIGGASVLASAELDEGDEAKRPSVQIGDPFEEKKLLECCLELLQRQALRSLQDLGAAGLSSSSSEMASKGGVGIDLDVARVPLREADMEPFEIMISESQERMLCVVEPGAPRRAGGGLRPLGGAPLGDRRGHRQRPPARLRRRRAGGRHAGARPRGRLSALRPRAGAARGAASTRRRTVCSTPTTRASACSPCSARPTSAPAGRSSSSTTGSCSRARCAAPRNATPRCCSSRPTADAARSRCRSTATGAGWPATPTRAPWRRCSSARPTSPAPAPSRSA